MKLVSVERLLASEHPPAFEPRHYAQDRALKKLKRAISLTDLEAVPRSWYYLGPVSALGAKPKPFDLWGKPLIAYRDAHGRVVVQSRHCIHMNTDLSQARVTDRGLECPMHGWRFDADGVAEIPGTSTVCPRTLPTYPVARVGGHCFVFNGGEPDFPLPLAEPEWTHFDIGQAITLESDTAWYLIGANGFDVGHFEFVHGRKLTSPADLRFVSHHACRILLRYANVSQSLLDRLLRKLYGPRIELEYQVFGGNLILARTRLGGGKENCMCFSVQPLGPQRSRVVILPLTKRGAISPSRAARTFARINPLSRLYQWLRSVVIHQFFAAEARSIRDLRLNPKALSETDRTLARFLAWLSQRNALFSLPSDTRREA